MRIALVCEYATLNGGERSLLAALDLIGTDIEPVFFAPASGPLAKRVAARRWRHVPFELRDAHGAKRSAEVLVNELAEAVSKESPDLVHANSLSMGRLTGQLAESVPIPCAAHLRDILRLSRRAIDDLGRNARLFAVSDACREFHTRQGLAADRVTTLYNGVDVDRFRPAASEDERHRLRIALGVRPEDFLAVTVGQLGMRKGQDVLLKAVEQIAGDAPHFRLWIVGERCSGKPEAIAYEQGLHRQVARFGGSGVVRFAGVREDMAELMRAADLLIHPARQEPLGRVLLEAAASGLPIVATQVGGTAEIVEHERGALLVPPGDDTGLVDSIRRLLSEPETRQRFSESLRQTALQRFDIRCRAVELLDEWRSLSRPQAS